MLIIDFKNKSIKGICKARDFKQGKIKNEIIELINNYIENEDG